MNCSVPVLAYHRVAEEVPSRASRFCVSPQSFREQMRFLRDRGYHSISVSDWAFCVATQRHVPGRPVAITFDDGYADFAINAWPILQEMNFRATVFVVAGRVGAVADWDRAADRPHRLMGWDDLRAMQQAGNAIGSHCNAHRDLTRLSDDEIEQDAAAARDAFRRELAVEATCVAFPWGKSDRRVRLALGRAGYLSAVGVAGGLSTLEDEPLNLPRIEVFADDDLDAFARKVEAGRQSAERTASEALSRRIDRLMAELSSIREHLLALGDPLHPVADRLQRLFGAVLAGPRDLLPFEQLCPGVRVGFEATGGARCAIVPKPDDSVGPPSCVAAVRLCFDPPSRWYSVDAVVQWPELHGASMFQLSMSLKADRDVSCRIVLRIWQKDGQYREIRMADCDISTTEHHYNFSGSLQLPDLLECDQDSTPLLVVLFDTRALLTIELYHLALYFR